MQLHIHSQNIVTTDALRIHVEKRISTALQRANHAIRSVVLRFNGVNGSRNNTAKHVQLSIELKSGKQLFIEDRDRDVYQVVNRAAGRAKQAVRRYLQRRRTRQRAA